MEARSAGFHHLEEIVSAPVLLKGLTVHLREVSTLLHGSTGDRGDSLRRRLIVVAGESSVLAGWLASDIGDSVTARNFYDTAEKAAKEAERSHYRLMRAGLPELYPKRQGRQRARASAPRRSLAECL